MRKLYSYWKYLLTLNVIIFLNLKLRAQSNLISEIEINDSVIYQTIDNFGASDAWSIQYVGLWPNAKKQQIAKLLFSKDFDDTGKALGIGLSLWRINLGGGSFEQGDNSHIQDEWHRGRSFLKLDGTHDWSALRGQIWMASAAKSFHVKDLLLFTNSPHVNFTRNGIAHASKPNRSNLSETHYQNFAQYLADAIQGFKSLGLQITYLSPFNEPQWDWIDSKQEGTSYKNQEIAKITRKINDEFEDRNISTLIDIPEAAQLNFLYQSSQKKPANQIFSFFNENSDYYLGDLENISHKVSGHSYFTTSPAIKLLGTRQNLKDTLDNYPDLKFWMSEYCILGDNYGEIIGNGRDLGIEPALYMAKVIHNDLTVANASAWHWWLAVSPYDYKDGLIYIDKNKTDGKFYESKLLWTLGNFSRFIRPGYYRIQVKSNDENLLVSGYSNGAEKVIVVINSESQTQKLRFLNMSPNFQPKTYITSTSSNLSLHDIQEKDYFILPERSITTFLIQ